MFVKRYLICMIIRDEIPMVEIYELNWAKSADEYFYPENTICYCVVRTNKSKEEVIQMFLSLKNKETRTMFTFRKDELVIEDKKVYLVKKAEYYISLNDKDLVIEEVD